MNDNAPGKQWIQAAVRVPDGNVEAISARLGAVAHGGVWIRECPDSKGFSEVAGYFVENSQFTSLADNFKLLFKDYTVILTHVPDNDWVTAFKESCPAFAVGKRFWIAPSWDPTPAPEGREPIMIDPRLGFGSGRHETTQMMIELMEEHLVKGANVLDVGCGSGILCVAAIRLGASCIEAVEMDPTAVDSAITNFRENGIPDGRIKITEVDICDYASQNRPDLILANLETDIFARCSPALARLAGGETKLVLSGVEVTQKDKAVGILTKYFNLLEQRTKGDWFAFLAEIN